ncbi:MAG TPA: hypothetical protein VF183_02030 [Acidimicrobiales bacterium]
MPGSHVTVPLDDARVGRLPRVCVTTGERADGYAPMIVPRRLGVAWLLLLAGPIGVAVLVALYPRLRTRDVVRIPMSAGAFDRWQTERLRRLWCGWLGAMGIPVAFALRALGPLALVVALASAVLLATALRAHWRIPWLQPSMSADPRGVRLTMLGVHERFAAAIGSSTSP